MNEPMSRHTGIANTKRSFLLTWILFAVVIAGPLIVGANLSTRAPATVFIAGCGVILGLLWTAVAKAVMASSRWVKFGNTKSWWLAFAGGHLLAMTVTAVVHGLLMGLIALSTRAEVSNQTVDRIVSHTVASVIPLYAALVAVTLILDMRNRAQSAELQLADARRLSAEAKLQTLRSQLNPHFLFNTLNTVAMAVRTSDREQALSILLDLSALLRTSLRRTSTQVVPLADEIEFLTKYLEIEQFRFRDRLRVEWAVAPEARGAAVPAMILQPLVENALHHGVARRSDAGWILIEAQVTNGELKLKIQDDGPGFADAWNDGVGIANVRSRLALHYPETGRIDAFNIGRGAAVLLSFPFTEYEKNEEVQNDYRG